MASRWVTAPLPTVTRQAATARCSPERFTDVRELLRQVKAAGIEPVMVNADTDKGPASFMVVDPPDGNPVLFDQHAWRKS